MRVVRIGVLVALLLAACGGSDDTTTTAGAAGETTTTAGDGGETVDFGDIPEECLDIFGDMLRAIEPSVDGVDFDNATMDDLEALNQELESSMAEFDQDLTATGCEELNIDTTTEESFQFMIDFAEDEAPGTVAWLEWIRDLSADFGEGGGTATGDCEQDIAALMEFVNAGGTMSDLTMAELTTVGELMGSISTACSVERYEELFSDPAIADFLESGG